jgi:hypothetical protein
MTRPAWHSTWTRMRRVGRRRSWMTWGEFQGLLMTLGVSLTPYHVKQATRGCPPVRVHGAKRYEDRHVQMAVGYAKAKGLVRIAAPQPEEVTA